MRYIVAPFTVPLFRTAHSSECFCVPNYIHVFVLCCNISLFNFYLPTQRFIVFKISIFFFEDAHLLYFSTSELLCVILAVANQLQPCIYLNYCPSLSISICLPNVYAFVKISNCPLLIRCTCHILAG